MKNFITEPYPKDIRKTARRVSELTSGVWYVLRRGTSEAVVSDSDLGRYLRLGYRVTCCYHNGTRHRNAFWDSASRRWTFTES